MFKRIFGFSALAFTLIATALRTWQLNSAIDKSGFYLPQYQTLCTVMEYAIIGIGLLFLAVGRLALAPKGEVAFPQKNPVLGGACLLLTLSCIFQGLTDYNTASSDVLGLLGFLACFVTALAFGIVGTCKFQGKTAPFAAAALPIVSQLVYLVLQYANFNGISQISENVLFILFICSFLGLVMSQGRLLSGVNPKKGAAWAYGTAALTALFGLMLSVPHWIMGQNQFPVSFMAFGAGVYALVLLLQLPRFPVKEEA